MRASIVCEPTLALLYAEHLNLGDYLFLGKGRGCRPVDEREIPFCPMPLEALIGAIYLDGGFANAKEFIHRFMLNDMWSISSSFMIARLSCRRSCREMSIAESWSMCW